MALKFDRPSSGLMRELSAVARRAGAFETSLSANTNCPPEALPLLQLSEILAVLKSLPLGTAEGGRLQLITADARLNEIRLEFFSLADDEESEDPGFMRDVPLDDALSLLIAAVRTALSAANREGGLRRSEPDETTPTGRSDGEVELEAAAIDAANFTETLEAAQTRGRHVLNASSARGEISYVASTT